MPNKKLDYYFLSLHLITCLEPKFIEGRREIPHLTASTLTRMLNDFYSTNFSDFSIKVYDVQTLKVLKYLIKNTIIEKNDEDETYSFTESSIKKFDAITEPKSVDEYFSDILYYFHILNKSLLMSWTGEYTKSDNLETIHTNIKYLEIEIKHMLELSTKNLSDVDLRLLNKKLNTYLTKKSRHYDRVPSKFKNK